MASPPRLFVADSLTAGVEVRLSAEQVHYLGTVLRRRAGDAVELFNGRDGAWAGTILALARARGSVVLTGCVRKQAAEPGPWLAFAPLKRDATDLVVRMATELGVATILPVTTERTNTTRLNLDRLIAIAIEAAEQCERLTIPAIHAPRRLADLLADWPADRRLFAALERSEAEQSAPAAAAGPRAADGAAGGCGLLVGPEGGFSPTELDGLKGSPIVVPMSLGRLILRAETACVAGLALLQARAKG